MYTVHPLSDQKRFWPGAFPAAITTNTGINIYLLLSYFYTLPSLCVFLKAMSLSAGFSGSEDEGVMSCLGNHILLFSFLYKKVLYVTRSLLRGGHWQSKIERQQTSTVNGWCPTTEAWQSATNKKPSDKDDQQSLKRQATQNNPHWLITNDRQRTQPMNNKNRHCIVNIKQDNKILPIYTAKPSTTAMK
jgi:hypothetical protein